MPRVLNQELPTIDSSTVISILTQRFSRYLQSLNTNNPDNLTEEQISLLCTNIKRKFENVTLDKIKDELLVASTTYPPICAFNSGLFLYNKIRNIPTSQAVPEASIKQLKALHLKFCTTFLSLYSQYDMPNDYIILKKLCEKLGVDHTLFGAKEEEVHSVAKAKADKIIDELDVDEEDFITSLVQRLQTHFSTSCINTKQPTRVYHNNQLNINNLRTELELREDQIGKDAFERIVEYNQQLVSHPESLKSLRFFTTKIQEECKQNDFYLGVNFPQWLDFLFPK
jgi:hypothetical protein